MKTLSYISTVVLLCLAFAAPAFASPTNKVTVEPATVARGGTPTYSPVTYKESGELNWEIYAYEPTIKLDGTSPAVPPEWFHPEEPRGGVIPGHLYEAKGTYKVCVGVDVLNAIPPEQVSESCTAFTVVESTAEAVAKEEAAKVKAEEEAAKVKAEEAAKEAQEKAARLEAENKAQEAQRNELERQAAATAQEAARNAAAAEASKAAEEAADRKLFCEDEPTALLPDGTRCPNTTPAHSTGKVITPPTLTKTEKLTKALRQCNKLKNKKKRVVCKKQAEKKYGAKPKRH